MNSNTTADGNAFSSENGAMLSELMEGGASLSLIEAALTRGKSINPEYDLPDIMKQFRREGLSMFNGLEIVQDNGKKAKVLQFKPEDYSDAGNAELFCKIYGDDILSSKSLGALTWTGKKYEESESAARAKIAEFGSAMLSEAQKNFREECRSVDNIKEVSKDAQEYLSHAKRLRSAHSIDAVLSLVRAFKDVDAESFDQDGWLLNTPECVIDLRSGERRPHEKALRCTKITACRPDNKGRDIWEKTLSLVFENDQDLMKYFQMVVGSSIVGKIYHEGIFILVGNGANGKSTIMNAIRSVMGDYAGSIDADVLTTERVNKGAALATLRGRRLVVLGELEDGQRLSTKTLKRIASTDKMVIEKKYQQPESVTPSHHLMMFSNFLPRIGSNDNGTWRRISIIPFNATIPQKEVISNFADMLAKGAGGAILQWAIEGAREFYEAGCVLTEPQKVRDATGQYRTQENWLANFLADNCKFDAKSKTAAGKLYQVYKDYSAFCGLYCRTMPDFNRAMLAEGFEKRAGHGNVTFWIGLKLVTGSEAEYNTFGSKASFEEGVSPERMLPS